MGNKYKGQTKSLECFYKDLPEFAYERTGEIQQESQGPETKRTHFLSLFLLFWIKTKLTSASYI